MGLEGLKCIYEDYYKKFHQIYEETIVYQKFTEIWWFFNNEIPIIEEYIAILLNGIKRRCGMLL